MNRQAAGDLSNAVGNGADVNQSCRGGSSLALEYGRADVVLALIRAGANLEYRDPYSRQADSTSNAVTSRSAALISTPIRCTARPGARYLSA